MVSINIHVLTNAKDSIARTRMQNKIGHVYRSSCRTATTTSRIPSTSVRSRMRSRPIQRRQRWWDYLVIAILSMDIIIFISFITTSAGAVAVGMNKIEENNELPSLFHEQMILQRHNFPIDPYDDLIFETNQQMQLSQSESTSSSSSSIKQSNSEDFETKQIRNHVTSRNLFLFGTATGSICSLSTEIFYFDRDPDTQLYYWNGDKNGILFSEIDSIWNSTVLDRWNVADQIQARNNVTQTTTTGMNDPNSTVAVRACLCTQYLNRPIEFCSAEFVSCSVRTTPVTCFTLSSTNTFIQSFWPVTIFWLLVMAYVWSCSDPGRIARQYYQRKFRCRCNRTNLPLTNTTADANNTAEQPIDGRSQIGVSLMDDQMIRQQLDSIIENYPSRANYMYREAINRQNRQERYARARESFLWYRTYQQMKRRLISFICCCCKLNITASTGSNTMANDNNDNVNESFANEMTAEGASHMDVSTRLTDPSGPRLLLKTKVYYFDDVEERTVTDGEIPENTSSHMHSNVKANDTSLIDDDENNSNNNINGDEIHCAICLLPLQDGIDIIGNLPCHHCMHKHCLKEWLMRKNRCPLCQLSDVAVYQDATHPTTTPSFVSR